MAIVFDQPTTGRIKFDEEPPSGFQTTRIDVPPLPEKKPFRQRVVDIARRFIEEPEVEKVEEVPTARPVSTSRIVFDQPEVVDTRPLPKAPTVPSLTKKILGAISPVVVRGEPPKVSPITPLAQQAIIANLLANFVGETGSTALEPLVRKASLEPLAPKVTPEITGPIQPTVSIPNLALQLGQKLGGQAAPQISPQDIARFGGIIATDPRTFVLGAPKAPGRLALQEARVTGRKAQLALTRAGVSKSEQVVQNLKTVKDIGPLSSEGLDTFRLSNQIDNSPLGPFHDEVTVPLTRKMQAQFKMSEGIITEMNDLIKKLKLKGSDSTGIRKFIEEGFTPPKGKEAAYTEMSNWLRTQYDDLLGQLNKARKANGQAPIPRRNDYVTHIEQLNVADDITNDITRAEISLVDEFVRPTEVGFRFAEPRTLQGIPEQKLAGAFEAFDTYARRAAKSIHLSDTVEKLTRFSNEAFRAGKKNLGEALQSWSNTVSGIPEAGGINRWFRDTRVGKLFRAYIGRTIKNVILGNFSVALNQTLAIGQLGAEVGPIRAISALTKTISDDIGGMLIKRTINPEYTKFAARFSNVYKLRLQRGIPELTETLKGSRVTEAIFGTIEKPMQALIGVMDRLLVETSFNAGFKKARGLGLSFRDAIQFGDDVAARTNALYDKLLKPKFLRGEAIQTIVPLQTIVVNNFNQIMTDIPRKGLVGGAKAVTNLMASGLMIRMGLEVIRPSRDGLFSQMLADVVPFLQSTRFDITPLDSILKVQRGEQKVSTFVKRRVLLPLLPFGGGAQLIKTGGAIRAIMGDNGIVRDSSGRKMFQIDSGVDRIRALVFGVYGTAAAKERFRKKK